MVINHNKYTLSIIYYYTTTEYYTGSYTLLDWEWDASQAGYVTGDCRYGLLGDLFLKAGLLGRPGCRPMVAVRPVTAPAA